VHVAGDRADHGRRGRTGALLDQGVQAVLRAQGLRHAPVLLEEPEAEDAPVAPGGREFLGVHREVRPVKPADPDVDEPRSEPVAVVSGNRNAARRDLGELCLAETDHT
jgi:hypothetical protein